MVVIRQLIDQKVLRILDLLINSKKLFHLSRISKDCKVPIGTTFRITNKLVSLDIIDVVTIGKMKIYKIADNRKTKELEFMLKDKK